MWNQNPVAPWPTDPSEGLKLNEMMTAKIADLMKKGEIEEFGYFPDGTSGYAIGKGDILDILKDGVLEIGFGTSDADETAN